MDHRERGCPILAFFARVGTTDESSACIRRDRRGRVREVAENRLRLRSWCPSVENRDGWGASLVVAQR